MMIGLDYQYCQNILLNYLEIISHYKINQQPISKNFVSPNGPKNCLLSFPNSYYIYFGLHIQNINQTPTDIDYQPAKTTLPQTPYCCILTRNPSNSLQDHPQNSIIICYPQTNMEGIQISYDPNAAQTPLARDIAKLHKKVIVQALRTLNIPVTSFGTKDKYANDFVKGINDRLEKSRQLSIPIDIAIKSICDTINQTGVINILKRHVSNRIQQLPRQLPSTNRKNLNCISNLNSQIKCICQTLGAPYQGDAIQCLDCYKLFHQSCLKIPKNQRFQCPNCFCKNMDPQNQVMQVLFCGYLNSETRVHKINFSYSYYADHQKYILQARSFRMDGKNNYLITWPDCGQVKFNDAKIIQWKPLAQNSSLKKRKDEIKVIDKKFLRTNNSIVITEPYTYSREYRVGHYNHFVMICLVKHYSNQELFQRILLNANSVKKHEQVSKVQINQDIEMQKVFVQLKCPLSFQRIKVPVKGRQCVHDTCIDLQSMILFNKSSHRQWKCPICKKKSHKLIINQMLYKIITQNSHLNLAGVTFLRDGTYVLSQQKPQESESDEVQRNKPAIVIDIQDDSEQVQFIQPPVEYRSNANTVVRDENRDYDLNRTIPLMDVSLRRKDSSDAASQQQMSLFNDPALRALSMAQDQFQEQFKQHQMQLIENQQKRMSLNLIQTQNFVNQLRNIQDQSTLDKSNRQQHQVQQSYMLQNKNSDSNKDYTSGIQQQKQKGAQTNNQNQRQKQKLMEVEVLVHVQNQKQKQNQKQNQNQNQNQNQIQFQKQIQKQKQMQIQQQKQKQNQTNLVNETLINKNSSEGKQDNDQTFILLHIPRKPQLNQQKTSSSTANILVDQVPDEFKNPFERRFSKTFEKNVINIIDSDQETEDERHQRLIRDQVFQLQQLALQKNILPSKSSLNQYSIFKGVVNRLFPGCI